jgi:GPH family glycoside/pentoside/hexuronide:cation symporter
MTGAEPHRISIGVKLGYGAGDFAVNMALNLTAMYMLYYYTDVFGIPAAAAGFILLFARMGLGFLDPFIGHLSDRVNTRWGKKRPFLLFGAVPLGLSSALLFASPDFGFTAKLVWATATFTVFFICLSLVNIPYTSLAPALTRDIHERSSLAGYKMVFAVVGTLFAAGATKPLVHLFADEIAGFRFVGGFYGVIMALAMLIPFFVVRENARAQPETSESVGLGFRAVLGNHPFLIMAAATTLFQTAMNILAAMVAYYFKYNLMAENLIPVAFVVLLGSATIMVPFYIRLSRRQSKKFAYILGMSIFAATLVVLFFIGKISPMATVAAMVPAGIGLSTVFLSPWAILPDVVEYHHWRMGERREGTIYGLFFLCLKMSAALAGFICGVGMDLSGFLPNAAQEPSALMGVRLLMTLVPAGFIVIGMLTLSRFPINEAFYRRMLQDIDSR